MEYRSTEKKEDGDLLFQSTSRQSYLPLDREDVAGGIAREKLPECLPVVVCSVLLVVTDIITKVC